MIEYDIIIESTLSFMDGRVRGQLWNIVLRIKLLIGFNEIFIGQLSCGDEIEIF